MGAMVGVLQQYVAAVVASPQGVPAELARRADGALLVVGVMADILKEKVRVCVCA